jgi:hypothetical protein
MGTANKSVKQPEVQLIANAVVTDGAGRVLLTRYGDEDDSWWLPASQLQAYEHPADALPRFAHGPWEAGVVAKALGG